MKTITINRRSTTFFSELANQINDHQEGLSKYIQSPFNLETFGNQIALKQNQYSSDQRALLYDVVKEQMTNYLSIEPVAQHVELLKKENTFTVTAGHQLNLYGGPLYLIYKIMDTIRLVEELSIKYPENHFVPVFWMGTEDHDFEEINHVHLFNDKISWNTEQKGPVGRFSLKNIDQFKGELKEKFTNNPDFVNFLDQFYTEENLSQANSSFLMHLLGQYGLIILDADDARLKQSFAPILQKEIETQFSEKEVTKTTKQLEEDGFHGQAMARPINLFYIKDQFRERIIPINENDFEIGTKTLSKSELLQELKEHPERFSPNVILRPLYQEYILPNLCYIGGGEMAYWLQFKGMFDQTSVPFPLLKVRNSLQWFDKGTNKKINKLDLAFTDVFRSIHEIKKEYVLENAEVELDFSELDQKMKDLQRVLEAVVVFTDKNLEQYAKSESTKIEKQISSIEEKLIRHSKKKNEDAMKQIESIYKRLFPEHGLQERYENMIPFLAKYGAKEFVHQLHELINPFEKDLILVIEE
ncbi:bacillithiol biosynthesis cysteine-adding enzyme BshC [Brumimicrobium salinarum]|uniref:Putative cysteine ligase BshC n=1 Tax=Brumimicrobium salinarum TaxID=2058658 RepID=A0A2I0R076_9FLAO|nr:bacillithiol biosynthesis cysteine-adding enzyme BshC [Brumimicrobium salinarum]PKR79969.1 bacillithiol biosynthesis cysteine-adding enzyme BshC [Brumimicrobium salinarum]